MPASRQVLLSDPHGTKAATADPLPAGGGNPTSGLTSLLYLLSFSFWEWAPSSADPTGNSMTFLPVAS